MSALPEVAFALPPKPRVKPKDAPPDQRRLAVLPIRAGKDHRLHGATLRTLIVLCSYVNRAGLTWVSQAKVASDLGVTRQAVQKQLALLQKTGYVQVVKKGWRGEFSNTLRVVFDDSIDVETAIAITSAQEDTRPLTMQDDITDPDGQKRIASLIAQALKQPAKRKTSMAKQGQSRTVKAIKEANQKGLAKRTNTQPSEVADEEALHRQPQVQPAEVAPTRENLGKEEVKDKNYEKTKGVLCNLNQVQVDELIAKGLREADIEECLDILLEAYRIEGLQPRPDHLVPGILELHYGPGHRQGT
jgi:predicted ArsR family transcriptional regulator